ncbi:hypothetical protein [Photorhabdus sp. CRCIA-P01]|uniref:hypothetical protein n=1 Tax=Photorhabdus sp. CRCIA-P01 TaxID=2019570 RepID=UPI0013004F4B|nr:hypothetical protein [Photorhabdus sp. CRCIA-P01]
MSKGNEMAKNTDWEGIERDYRSGLISIREIAKKYGISDAAIRKRAKTEEWVRTIVESTQCEPDANQAQSQVASSTSNILESEKFAGNRRDSKAAIRTVCSEHSCGYADERGGNMRGLFSGSR